MADHNRRTKRYKRDPGYAMPPIFDGVGAEYGAYQSRPPQQSRHDPLRSSGVCNHSQPRSETVATPFGRYSHGTESFQSDSDFRERTIRPSWHHNGYAPSAQQYLYNLASPNVESQNMAFTAEGVVDPQVYGRFRPRPHPPLLHQQSTGSSFTGSENGSNMYLHPGPGAVDQYTNVETSEDLLNLSPLLEPSSYDLDDTGMLDLDSIKQMDNGQSHAAPWSLFKRSETPGMPQHDGVHWTDHNGAPDSSASGYDLASTNSSYVMVPRPATSFLQSGIHSNGMYDSIATVHPVHGAPPDPHLYGQTNTTPGVSIQPATPPIGPSHIGPYFDCTEIQEESYTPSCTTDASSATTALELQCNAAGCTAVFRGLYAKGNLARHKRHNHNGPRVYICEDEGCDRVFRRQDARLKHYRKYHPDLASPYVARTDRDLALSNIGAQLD